MFTLNCKGRLLMIDKPIVMGIMNITPDSFYSHSRSIEPTDFLQKAEGMLSEGATIIDIGGQSTRPGSERVSADEELKRVMPFVEAASRKFPQAFISIDTFYAKVAKEAIHAGASMVNDISAGSIDEALIPTVAALNVPYVMMHMKGNPQTMQQQATYEDVTSEVFDFLSFNIAALHKAGINDIIVDPGFGFAKTIAHNFNLLATLRYFTQLQRPLMVGLSRKSTIYKTLDISPDEALNGTTVMHTIALLNGANILRVHDVKEAVEAIKLCDHYKKAKEQF